MTTWCNLWKVLFGLVFSMDSVFCCKEIKLIVVASNTQNPNT